MGTNMSWQSEGRLGNLTVEEDFEEALQEMLGKLGNFKEFSKIKGFYKNCKDFSSHSIKLSEAFQQDGGILPGVSTQRGGGWRPRYCGH